VADELAMTAVKILNPTPEPALAALAALHRAGIRAAQEALRTNTYMVVSENGTVERLSPQDYLRAREDAQKKLSD
jgi:hypothetical protein